MADDMKKDIVGAVLPGISDVDDDAVSITGYLGKKKKALRIFPRLEDRSTYVEFSEGDVVALVKHTPDDKVTVSLKPGAPVRSVRGEIFTEARFLSGAIPREKESGGVADPVGIASVDTPCGCAGSGSSNRGI